MKIAKTKDYDSFKFIMSNREIDQHHVKRLTRSIQRKNLLFIRPLIVNDKMFVIDGQHRLAAAKVLKADVYYVKVPGLQKADIAVLNTAQKNWTRTDFINFYATEGNENYKQLAAFIDKYYWLSPSAIIKIASGDPSGLREGKIKLKDTKRADQVFQWLRQLEGRFDFIAENHCAIAISKVIETKAQFEKFSAAANTATFTKCNSYSEYERLIFSLLK